MGIRNLPKNHGKVLSKKSARHEYLQNCETASYDHKEETFHKVVGCNKLSTTHLRKFPFKYQFQINITGFCQKLAAEVRTNRSKWYDLNVTEMVIWVYHFVTEKFS